MSRIAITLIFSSVLFSKGLMAEKTETLDCVVEPSMMVNLSSQVAGVIENIFVERGDFVSNGQLVAELKSGVEKAGVRLAEKTASLEVDVHSRRAEKQLKTNHFEQMEQLHEKKLLSHHDYDDAKTASVIAGYELEKAIEMKRLAGLELQRAREILNLRSIKSTVDGVAVEVMKFPGEYIEEQPLVKLAQIDPLYVEVIVPENLYGRVKIGEQLQVSVQYPVSASHLASVIVVDPVIDSSSGTFGVRLKLPNPDHKIPAGQRCEIALR